MDICKAPTLRLKALNKHTHIMYIEMENVICVDFKYKVHFHELVWNYFYTLWSLFSSGQYSSI